MIDKEKAMDFIQQIPPDEMVEFTFERLTGKDSRPVVDARLDEPREDVLIQALKNSTVDTELSRNIIKGCMKVYHYIEDVLVLDTPPESKGQFINIVRSLCRLVNIAKPEPLRKQSRALLSYLAPPESIDPDVGMHIVQAFMGFEQTEEDAVFWERLLQSEDYAAYAFNALLKLDPRHPRLDQALEKLEEKRVNEGLAVEVDFLKSKLGKQRGYVQGSGYRTLGRTESPKPKAVDHYGDIYNKDKGSINNHYASLAENMPSINNMEPEASPQIRRLKDALFEYIHKSSAPHPSHPKLKTSDVGIITAKKPKKEPLYH